MAISLIVMYLDLVIWDKHLTVLELIQQPQL